MNLAGKRWRLVLAADLGKKVWGMCDHPSTPRRTIRISRDAKHREALATIVHEVIHAAAPQLSEEAVLQLEKDLLGVIWHQDVLDRCGLSRK